MLLETKQGSLLNINPMSFCFTPSQKLRKIERSGSFSFSIAAWICVVL